MDELSITDKLLIKAASQNNDFLYNGDRSTLAKKNRKIFFPAFSSALEKTHGITMSETDVQSRFKYIRDSCVKADSLRRQNKKVPPIKQLLYNACPFLYPFIKHQNDATEDGSETSGASRSETPLSLANGEPGNGNHAQSTRKNDLAFEFDMDEAMANQREFDILAAGASTQYQAPLPLSKKRKTHDESQASCPKGNMQGKDNQDEGNHLQVLTDRMAQLLNQNDVLMKAKSRAKLVSRCIEELPMEKQVKCIPKVLEILQKYEKKD